MSKITLLKSYILDGDWDNFAPYHVSSRSIEPNIFNVVANANYPFLILSGSLGVIGLLLCTHCRVHGPTYLQPFSLKKLKDFPDQKDS